MRTIWTMTPTATITRHATRIKERMAYCCLIVRLRTGCVHRTIRLEIVSIQVEVSEPEAGHLLPPAGSQVRVWKILVQQCSPTRRASQGDTPVPERGAAFQL